MFSKIPCSWLFHQIVHCELDGGRRLLRLCCNLEKWSLLVCVKVIQAAVGQGERLLLTQQTRFTLDLSMTDVSFTTRARILQEIADLNEIYLFIWTVDLLIQGTVLLFLESNGQYVAVCTQV
jgi:hypothetical protein